MLRHLHHLLQSGFILFDRGCIVLVGEFRRDWLRPDDRLKFLTVAFTDIEHRPMRTLFQHYGLPLAFVDHQTCKLVLSRSLSDRKGCSLSFTLKCGSLLIHYSGGSSWRPSGCLFAIDNCICF